MTWFRIDDKFHDHPKVRRLGKDRLPAIGLWSACGSWAADTLSDGFVPSEVVRRFDPRERYAARLVETGLWSAAEHRGETGYCFHQWTDYQPTRSEVEDRRAERADAGRKGGLKSGQARAGRGSKAEATASADAQAVASDVASPVASRLVEANANPDPTRPIPKTSCGPVDDVTHVDQRASNLDLAARAVAAMIGTSRPNAIRNSLVKRAAMLLDDGGDPVDLAPALAEWRKTINARVTWLDHKFADAASRREAAARPSHLAPVEDIPTSTIRFQAGMKIAEERKARRLEREAEAQQPLTALPGAAS